MLASILLALSEWPHAEHAQNFAFWLANKGGGHISALAVIDIKSFEIPVLGAADGFVPTIVSPPIAESQALLEDLMTAARDRIDRFAQECQARESSCSTEIRTGIPGDVIASEAVGHDMIVMSRAGYTRASRGDEKVVDPLVSGVIRGSIRPVLVAGKAFPASGSIQRIMVAFDGSHHAARALNVAVELGSGEGVDCILAVVAPTEEAGREVLAPAESYLRRHGVRPKKKVVIGTKPSELICDIVGSVGCDLLIMGAFGHSPIREVFFGSTTERVLSHCEATVILQS
jgi:nucleotide-binding universal stress UspA family protein